jgi:hypothetical protein
MSSRLLTHARAGAVFATPFDVLKSRAQNATTPLPYSNSFSGGTYSYTYRRHLVHHMAHITHHTSHITHHTSHIAHHPSPITHHTSPITQASPTSPNTKVQQHCSRVSPLWPSGHPLIYNTFSVDESQDPQSTFLSPIFRLVCVRRMCAIVCAIAFTRVYHPPSPPPHTDTRPGAAFCWSRLIS